MKKCPTQLYADSGQKDDVMGMYQFLSDVGIVLVYFVQTGSIPFEWLVGK